MKLHWNGVPLTRVTRANSEIHLPDHANKKVSLFQYSYFMDKTRIYVVFKNRGIFSLLGTKRELYITLAGCPPQGL